MSEEAKSFQKINQSLHQDISKLWDECFGDLPIMVQRTLKAYALRKNNQAYTHHKHPRITNLDVYKNITVNVDDEHFPPTSIQTQTAQAKVDEIINKMKQGKSRAARYLRYFLRDKTIKISVNKSSAYDAGMSGYNPLTKEIYIDLCAGCFYQSDNPTNLINEDNLAMTVGHEIAHAVERFNRSSKSKPETISSNAWEIESFCDAFGARLAADAGYSLVPKIEMMQEGINKKREPVQPNPHPPLKNRLEQIEYMELIFQTKTRSLTLFNDQITTLEWDSEKLEKKVWNNLKMLLDKKTPKH